MLGRHKGVLAIALALSLVAAGVNLAQPMLVNKMLNQFGQRPVGGIVVLLTILLLAGAIADGTQTYLLTRTAERSVFFTRIHLIRRMLRLPIPTFNTLRSGDLVTRLGSDTTLIRTAFTGGLVDAVASAFTMVGAVALMATLDTILLLVVLTVVVLAMVTMMVVSRQIQKFTKGLQTAVGELGAEMNRDLLAVRTIRAANAQQRVEGELVHQANLAWQEGAKIAKFQGLLSPLMEISIQLCFLLVLGVGGMRVAGGNMQLGELVAFVMYLFTLSSPIGMLFGAVTAIRSAMGAVERINEMLDLPEEDDSGPDAAPAASLSFVDVNFSYSPDQPTPTLKNLTFDVPAGRTVALVGPSGSGKSTTLALMQRFYDPSSGTIRLGGQDVSRFNRTSLRRSIGFVEQEAAILSGTVRNNLQLGSAEATDVQCWEALRRVGLEKKFQEKGAKGLDTLLGERGLSLSGGQRQRLALARMLLMNTPILLLDEPTSAVDSRNEELILDAIVAEGRTVVMAAHRLSTVTNADQILVMDKGELVARGTHKELLRTSELYRELARRQLLS